MVDGVNNYTLENAFLPGKFETWNVIIDCSGIGFMDAPVSDVITVLQGDAVTMAGHARGSYFGRN